MKTAIILHGMPDKEEYYDPNSPSQSNKHWIPWLQRQLTLQDILAQAIELPKPYEPNYEAWKRIFEQFEVNDETILVGHSCGGGFLARWLSENKTKVSHLILVAPWIDPDKLEHDKVGDFFEFTLDSTVQDRVKHIHLFVAQDEPDDDVKKSVQILKEAWPESSLVELPTGGHFVMSQMKTEQFPELLTALQL